MSDDQTVSIEMSEDALKTIESVMPPAEQTQPTPFEIDANGKTQCKLCNMILADKPLFDEHFIKAHETKTDEVKEEVPPAQPQRNEKGQFVEGNTQSVGNSATPCSFCQKPVEVLQKVKLYSHWTRGKVDGKVHMPWLEELCDEDYLDIDEDTLTNWTKHAHDKTAHAELIGAIKRLFTRQKGYLKKRILSDKTPAGGIFLLKANHGLIETEKQIHTGDSNAPLEFVITEERKIPTDD